MRLASFSIVVLFIRAAKAQVRLCIGIYSTEPAFLPNPKISEFFSCLLRAAKVQARLCIGINSTEPSLLENAIRTTFPVLFSHSLINASSECSGKTAHYYKLI